MVEKRLDLLNVVIRVNVEDVTVGRIRNGLSVISVFIGASASEGRETLTSRGKQQCIFFQIISVTGDFFVEET